MENRVVLLCDPLRAFSVHGPEYAPDTRHNSFWLIINLVLIGQIKYVLSL